MQRNKFQFCRGSLDVCSLESLWHLKHVTQITSVLLSLLYSRLLGNSLPGLPDGETKWRPVGRVVVGEGRDDSSRYTTQARLRTVNCVQES